MLDGFLLWPVLLASLVFIVLGLITWVGLNRAVVLRAWPSPTMHLAPLYLGTAGLLVTLSPLAPEPLALVVALMAMVVFAVGVMAVLWLPGFLKPRWLREATPWQDPYDLARQADRPQILVPVRPLQNLGRERPVQYRYGRDWHSFKRVPMNEITEEEARRRWEKGPAFSVTRLRDGAEVPDWTLLVSPGGPYLKVSHYDRNGSTVEVQHWQRQEVGHGLFLHQLTTYVYPDGATRTQDAMGAIAHTTWQFWPDGRALSRKVITSQPEARITRYEGVDVSLLWGLPLTFGEWDRWGVPLDESIGPGLVSG